MSNGVIVIESTKGTACLEGGAKVGAPVGLIGLLDSREQTHAVIKLPGLQQASH